MKESSWLHNQIRIMQIIRFALIVGVASFAVFVIFASTQPPPRSQQLSWLLAGFGVACLGLRFFVPKLILRTSLHRIASGAVSVKAPWPNSDEAQLAMAYQTQSIVGAALLEGGAFANLIGCMTTRHEVNWIVSGILLLGLFVDFPTYSSVKHWIEAQLVEIHRERMSTP